MRLFGHSVTWMLRQLLPLHYRSHYGEVRADGTVVPHVAVWRMWFGRVFAHEDHIVVPVTRIR